MPSPTPDPRPVYAPADAPLRPRSPAAGDELKVVCDDTAFDYDAGQRLWRKIFDGLQPGYARVQVSLAPVVTMDSRGGAWLRRIAREGRDRGLAVDFVDANGRAGAFLELIRPGFGRSHPRPPRIPGFLETVGGMSVNAVQEFRDLWRLLANASYWGLVAPFTRRSFRWNAFLDELYEVGVGSVSLVVVVNVLMGLIICILSAVQAQRFGAEIFIADAIVLGFSRELAVIMTAVVVAARSGAYTAAELATMTVQEEIDALRTMGRHPVQFLVVPKLFAVNAAMPILTLIGLAAGIAGGTAYATLLLDIPLDRWWAQTVGAFTLFDVTQGVLKSFVFGSLIIIIGCHNGLRVTGGARGVGLATTRSVVQDVVLVVVFDMFFAIAFTWI